MATRESKAIVFQNVKEILESYVFFPVTSTDAEILPCIHVLCKSCVETISSRADKRPGDLMGCAVCKLEFELPSTEVLDERKTTKELLSEFSKAANDVKHLCQMCCEENLWTWKEMNSRTASTHCAVCSKYACYQCAENHKNTYHQSVKKRSHLIEKPPSLRIYNNCRWHKKQLEVFCILCGKAGCFLCFVDNLPEQIKEDFDRVINNKIFILTDLAKEFSAIKTRQEKEARQFDTNVKELEKQISDSYDEQVKAVTNYKKLLLDQLQSIKTEVKAKLKDRNSNIDTLMETAERYSRSCASNQSISKPEELFCKVGAVIGPNKADELKRELDSWIEFTLPTTSYEPPDLERFLKTNVIQVDWKDQRKRDNAVTDADDMTNTDQTTNAMARNPPESGDQGLSSTQRPSKRSENESATFDTLTKDDQNYTDRENCDITFPEAIANYKKTLENLRNKTIPNKLRAKDKKSTTLLKKDEVEAFRLQFDRIQRIRPENWESKLWKGIEQCHENLAKLAYAGAEGQRYTKMLNEANDIIDDLLKKMTAMEKRPEQGLSNFGNTCYFNAVIQCLCQTFPVLEELCSSRCITSGEGNQPLTEAFIRFLNDKCLDSSQQTQAYYNFFLELCTSSTKFNNFRQHDSHDLFIHFLNDLRSEERPRKQGSRLSIDPKKMLTAVDKVFGGHFITLYSCLQCYKPYFVCEALLDISLPICISQLKHYREGKSGGITGIGGADQMWRQQDYTSTSERCKNLSHSRCSDQGKEFKRTFLEALNEEQPVPTDEGRGYRMTPVTLTECLRFYTATERIPEGYLCLFCQDRHQSAATANAQTMPPAIKRTLIYNPPAILVLHMKRFERTATGFTKRSDTVTYEDLLDLGPYCSSDCLRIDPEDKNVWYSLYGVVVHMGSLDFGHYIAYVKIRESNSDATKTFRQTIFLDRDKVTTEQEIKLTSRGKRKDRKVEWRPKKATDGHWIYMSDSNTRDATLSEALNQEAFMLFYERIAKRGQ